MWFGEKNVKIMRTESILHFSPLFGEKNTTRICGRGDNRNERVLKIFSHFIPFHAGRKIKNIAAGEKTDLVQNIPL